MCPELNEDTDNPNTSDDQTNLHPTTPDLHERWTSEQLKQAQEKDLTNGPILRWMGESSNRPLEPDVQEADRSVKRLLLQWERLVRRDGVLYRKWISVDGHSTRLKLVTPRSLVPEILQQLHSSPVGGHLRILKTTEKIRERFYWLGLEKDVELWC